ncbi:fork head transcription factor, partial [Clavulina sp. PMI_390]
KLPPGARSREKPTWSYAALIGQAILASPQQKLSLNQIYNFISMAYPFYEPDQAGWRNSIRHNLSLNGSFMKVPREVGARGKGSLWTINPQDLECFKGGGYIRRSSLGRKRKA